jgi:hypothetical protein
MGTTDPERVPAECRKPARFPLWRRNERQLIGQAAAYKLREHIAPTLHEYGSDVPAMKFAQHRPQRKSLPLSRKCQHHHPRQLKPPDRAETARIVRPLRAKKDPARTRITEDPGTRGDAHPAVQYHDVRIPPLHAPHIKAGVVSAYCSRSDEDRVVRRPPCMHQRPRLRGRNPALLSSRSGDVPVGAPGDFDVHIRAARGNLPEKVTVQGPGLVGLQPDLYSNPGPPEPCNPPARNTGIWIAHRYNHPADAGSNDGLCTWRRLTKMRAWLKVT